MARFLKFTLAVVEEQQPPPSLPLAPRLPREGCPWIAWGLAWGVALSCSGGICGVSLAQMDPSIQPAPPVPGESPEDPEDLGSQPLETPNSTIAFWEPTPLKPPALGAEIPHNHASDVDFYDVQPGYWAEPFIKGLAGQDLVTGFPDGNFRPQVTLDRSQLRAWIATIARQNQPPLMPALTPDENHHPDPGTFGLPPGANLDSEVFQGEAQGDVSRLEVLMVLGWFLQTPPQQPVAQVLAYYEDYGLLPAHTWEEVAAATEQGLVVGYPNPQVLNPMRPITRGEAAALVYQFLAVQGRVPAVDSPYIAQVPGLAVAPKGGDHLAYGAWRSGNRGVLPVGWGWEGGDGFWSRSTWIVQRSPGAALRPLSSVSSPGSLEPWSHALLYPAGSSLEDRSTDGEGESSGGFPFQDMLLGVAVAAAIAGIHNGHWSRFARSVEGLGLGILAGLLRIEDGVELGSSCGKIDDRR